MAKQQALFDHEQEQSEQDRENAAREREELKCLNDNSSPRSRPFKILEDHLHSQRGPLIRRLQVVSTLKAEGVAEQPPPLHRSHPTTSLVCLIPVLKIDMIILGGQLRSSSVSKISISLYQSESKRRAYHITADSESSPSMHPTPLSLRAYWNINFPRSS